MLGNVVSAMQVVNSAVVAGAQVVLFMSMFGALYSGAMLVLTGEAWGAVAHTGKHPEVRVLSPRCRRPERVPVAGGPSASKH